VVQETLADNPIEVRALLETTKGDYFQVWPVESFASLNLGDFAEVNVFETIQPAWICPAVSNAPGWHRPYNEDTGSFQCFYCPKPYDISWRKASYAYQKGSWYCNRPRPKVVTTGGGGRTYNECSEEEKKSSCGCVPCDYIVSGLKRRIENGPIAGAKVEIIKVSDVDDINPTVLYRGSTTDNEDIFQSGLLEIPEATLATFKDDEYYLVLAEGGRDIDRNDDMVRDSVPTENNGTIHAIIRGDALKKLPFRVNILTEAIYQVSGDSIGLNYDTATLQTKLDTTAQKLINHKLYPGDDDNRINYKDVLLWTPAVDKKALYKPFATYVEPIIASLYADEERFDESYRLIYEPYASNAPQLEPLALEIPEGLDDDNVIAQVKTGNKKVFDHVVLQGNFSEHFSIDTEGYIHIAQSQLIEDGNRYRLLMKAVDVAGREGSLVSLTIDVNGKLTQADPTTCKPRFISAETFDTVENAPEGTVVAKIHFEDSNQTIVSYTLSGQDSSMFVVDNQGVVSVAANADIDYEKSKVYHFKISAKNDAGNESYPVGIAIAIINQLDTPLFDLVVFEHLEENIPKGSVITTIRADREGLGDIEKFEILSPNIPFTIDNNGTLIVSNYIDYEQVKQYDFYAIARTKYGNSNKIEIHIVIDNQDPETGVPTLEDLTIIVDENVTSGSKIGQLTLDTGATATEIIALYGEDDNFRVDNNGSIYLASHAKLDFETKTRYDLGARALNSRGYGNEVHIVIEVKNIADELPVLTAFRGSVEENATADTEIGQIVISGSREVDISSFELIGEGSGNFSIDSNGTIRVSRTAQLDYESENSYLLQAVASSNVGINSEVEVIIYILNVPEHVPVLKAFIESVEENTTVGTIVGQIEEDAGGDSPIVSYVLDDNGTFSIDENGIIRVNAVLDYETNSSYMLRVRAANILGMGSAVPVQINIIDVPDVAAVLQAFDGDLDENATDGTVFGQITIADHGDTPISDILLLGSGSKNFIVDTNGSISVASGATLDYETIKVYDLNATAVNLAGDSESVHVKIVINNIPEFVPNLISFHGSVDENATEGTIVGKIEEDTGGDTAIYKYKLYGTGLFGIDDEGVLKLNEKLDFEKIQSYDFYVTATNLKGESELTPVHIDVSNIMEWLSVIIKDSNQTTMMYAIEEQIADTQMQKKEHKLFILSYSNNRMDIVNIDNIHHPLYVGYYNTDSFFNALDVIYAQNRVYLAHSHGFSAIDISNLSEPILLGKYLSDRWSFYEDTHFSHTHFIVYRGCWADGLEIVDATDANNMQLTGFYSSNGYIEGMAVDSNDTFAYLATLNEGLEIIDIQDIWTPYRIGQYMGDDGFYATRLLEDDQKLYLRAYTQWDVVDISDPSEPVHIKFIDDNHTEAAVESKFGVVIQDSIDEINSSTGEEGSFNLVLQSNIDINLTAQVITSPENIIIIDNSYDTEIGLHADKSKEITIHYTVIDSSDKPVAISIQFSNEEIILEKKVHVMID